MSLKLGNLRRFHKGTIYKGMSSVLGEGTRESITTGMGGGRRGRARVCEPEKCVERHHMELPPSVLAGTG